MPPAQHATCLVCLYVHWPVRVPSSTRKRRSTTTTQRSHKFKTAHDTAEPAHAYGTQWAADERHTSEWTDDGETNEIR